MRTFQSSNKEADSPLMVSMARRRYISASSPADMTTNMACPSRSTTLIWLIYSFGSKLLIRKSRKPGSSETTKTSHSSILLFSMNASSTMPKHTSTRRVDSSTVKMEKKGAGRTLDISSPPFLDTTIWRKKRYPTTWSDRRAARGRRRQGKAERMLFGGYIRSLN